MTKDWEMLGVLKEILDEIRLLRKAIENAKPPSPLVINRVADRDPYPPVTPPPLGWGIPTGSSPPGPPGFPPGKPPVPSGCPDPPSFPDKDGQSKRDRK